MDFKPETLGGYVAAILAGAASVFTGWRVMRNQNSGDSVSRASNEANIAAIDTYKEMVEKLQAAKDSMEARLVTQISAAEARADRFAEERNEAWKELYQVKGKLEAMADQIMMLRAEVAQLKGTV